MTIDLAIPVDKLLVSTLRAAAPVQAAVAQRVFERDAVPGGTAFPYIRVGWMSGVALSEVAGTKILDTFVYIVEAVINQPSYVALQPAVNAIYATLHRFQGQNAEVLVRSCVAETTERRGYVEDGVNYRHAGYGFRIKAQVPS